MVHSDHAVSAGRGVAAVHDCCGRRYHTKWTSVEVALGGQRDKQILTASESEDVQEKSCQGKVVKVPDRVQNTQSSVFRVKLALRLDFFGGGLTQG